MESQVAVQTLAQLLPVVLQREGLPRDVKYLRDHIRCAIYSKGFQPATNLRLITVLECLSAFQAGHMSTKQMNARLQTIAPPVTNKTSSAETATLTELKQLARGLQVESRAKHSAKMQGQPAPSVVTKPEEVVQMTPEAASTGHLVYDTPSLSPAEFPDTMPASRRPSRWTPRFFSVGCRSEPKEDSEEVLPAAEDKKATSPSSENPPTSNPPSRWTPRFFIALASGNSHKGTEVKANEDTDVQLKQDTVQLKQDTVQLKQDTVQLQQDPVQLQQDTEVEPKMAEVQLTMPEAESSHDTEVLQSEEEKEGGKKSRPPVLTITRSFSVESGFISPSFACESPQLPDQGQMTMEIEVPPSKVGRLLGRNQFISTLSHVESATGAKLAMYKDTQEKILMVEGTQRQCLEARAMVSKILLHGESSDYNEKVTVITASTDRPRPTRRLQYTREELLALNPLQSLPRFGVACELGLIALPPQATCTTPSLYH